MKVDAGNGVNFFRMRIIPILAIALLAGACSRKTPAPAVVRPVKVATAAGAGLIDKDFAGMATPDDAVNLAFKVAGQVLDVPVSQGAGVKKGELLAELDPRDIELQVAATRSAFEETRSQQQRMQRLLEHALCAGPLDLREHPRPAEGHPPEGPVRRGRRAQVRR